MIGVPNRIQQILAQAATPDPTFQLQPGQAVELVDYVQELVQNLVRFT